MDRESCADLASMQPTEARGSNTNIIMAKTGGFVNHGVLSEHGPPGNYIRHTIIVEPRLETDLAISQKCTFT